MKKLLLAIALAMALHASAQETAPTNSWNASIEARPEQIVVTNATEAFRATLHFMGFSPEQIAVALLALSTAAKFLRTYVTKDSNGKFAAVVGHLALRPVNQSPPTSPLAAAPGSSLPYTKP